MDAADAEDFCRICFGNAEPQLRARGRLISPCACTGSVRHIHLHCLRTWQATQSMQGRVRKARACELCKCRYVVPRDVLREEAADQGRVAKLRLAIEERWSLLNSRRPRPLWLEYLLWWCQIVLVAAECRAGWCAVQGLAAAGQVELACIHKAGPCLISCAPNLMMTAALFPSLTGLIAGSSALLVKVWAAAVVAMGLCYGFWFGAMCSALWAVKVHLKAAAVGAKCAGLTLQTIGQMAMALGSRLHAFKRKEVLVPMCIALCKTLS